MLFKSKMFQAWDTWMYYHEGKYYLYYLINGRPEGGGWNGFGVAESEDGVHFTDHGRAIYQSEQNTFYLGTGSVWKKSDFETSRTFICNYSEHRKTPEGQTQNIFFAESKDLIHWEKLGDEKMFSPDDTWYQVIDGRWDCIYPLAKPEGGYYGYFTASPKGMEGVGVGESEDGVHWRALPPAEIDLNPLYENAVHVEAGAIVCNEGKYYLMVGSGMEMLICCGDSPAGPFRLLKKGGRMSANNGQIYSYFPRFFRDADNLLVNFHVIPRTRDENGNVYTYLSPIKKVVFDGEGILRWYWWEKNDVLLGTESAEPQERIWTAEVDYRPGSVMEYQLTADKKLFFTLSQQGCFKLWDEEGETYEIDRGMKLGENCKLRILVRNEFLEIYADEEFLLSYTAKEEILQAVYEECPVEKKKLLLPQ